MPLIKPPRKITEPGYDSGDIIDAAIQGIGSTAKDVATGGYKAARAGTIMLKDMLYSLAISAWKKSGGGQNEVRDISGEKINF